MTKTFTSEEDKETQILFDEPVRIHAGETYSLLQFIFGPPGHRGNEGETSVTCEESGVTFKFEYCPASSNGSSVDMGQCPILYFYV